jgi:short-subunit dehydrogenase
MNLKDSRILLTGAAGGIGHATAVELARAGARVALVDRNLPALNVLAAEMRVAGGQGVPLAGDLVSAGERERLVAQAREALGGIDTLINLAGVLDFTPFEAQAAAALERLIAINLVVPMQLTQACLRVMLERGHGRIVNVGSTFGSIGFPFFAAYSASKFGLRGFSQALRRELAGSGVGVTYVAPRATRTPLNTSSVVRMNEALKVAMDPPQFVAAAIARAIEQERDEVYLGWPEKLFVRLNALLPRLVDGAMRKQHGVMRRYADGIEARAARQG